MPDENRFARLGEAIGESNETDDREEAGGSGESESSRPEASEPELSEAASESEPEAPDDGDAAEESDSGGASGGPAFEFEAATAKSMYVRPETVDVVDDAEFEVEAHLRREHDVRDATGREFHDALLRVAAAYPEEVADAILDARNIDARDVDE